MKKLACIVGVLVLIIGTMSGIALGQDLVLYDNFDASFLNPESWLAGLYTDPGIFLLDLSRVIKNEATLNSKTLNLVNRSYAYEGSNSGSRASSTRLFFADGSNITTIQAVVLVKKIQSTGCALRQWPSQQ